MPHAQRKQHQNHSRKLIPELGLLFFKADGSQVTIQHSWTPADGPRPATVPSLRLDLRSGKAWVGPAAPLPADSPVTLGIVGLLRLEKGSILVLVSKAKRVCGLLDGPVYKVEDTTLVAPETLNASANDLRYAALIQEALNPKCFGGHLYFSHTANITCCRQRQQGTLGGDCGEGGGSRTAFSTGANGLPSLGAWWASAGGGGDPDSRGQGQGVGAEGSAASGRTAGGGGGGLRGSGARGGGTLWSRADPRFVWNRELMRPLIEAGAESFALPIMVGYVGQATGATFSLKAPKLPTITAAAAESGAAGPDDDIARSGAGDDSGGGGGRVPGDLTLITRLGVERPVAGCWRRGADQQGHTAGFAETEIILTLWQPEEAGGPRPPQSPAGNGGTEGGDGSGAAAAAATAAEATGSGRDGGDGWLRQRTRVAVASYVMARGSAPLYWAAPPNLRPCPAPRGPEDPQRHAGPFTQHMEHMLAAYGRPVLLLNLIFGANQRQQLRLHDALQQQVAAFCARVREQQQQHRRQQQQREALGGDDVAALKDAARGQGEGEAGAALADADANAAAAAAAGAGPSPSPGVSVSLSAPVSVVGLLLRRGELAQLASCGGAAARLEREVAAGAAGRIRAFLSLDDLEMAVQLPPPPAGSAPDAAAAAAGGGGGSVPAAAGSGRRSRTVTTCVGRRVYSRQEGVVRVSSGSTASAGGCCEEVDLAQHALVLPVLAEALVALGAMDDVADLAAVHGSVMHALAQLWSHEADVLSDQTLGTGSVAGRLLREAAAGLEGRGWSLRGWLRAPYDRAVSLGDAISRYYYSNFTDARRQDALDLASGAFKVSSPPVEMPRRRPPNTTMLQLGILLLVAATIQSALLVFQRPTGLGEVGTRVLGPAALGALLLLEVLRQGTAFVEQPLLPPLQPPGGGGGTFPWAQ